MTKQCSCCGLTKELELFYASKLGKLGRRADCKLCAEAKRRERTGAMPRRNLRPGYRYCSICNAEKTEDNFGHYYRKDRNVYEWDSRCKGCNAKRKKASYDPEKARAYQQRYYADNVYQLREKSRLREREKRQDQQFAVRHREAARAYRADPTKRDILHAQSMVKRARAAGALRENVDRRALLERDSGECGICGEPVDPNNFHVDHVVPLSKGGEHSYANTQVAHPLCNMSKHARLPEDVLS